MYCERIALDTPNAYLEPYFLSLSPEMPASQKRPAVLICPGGGYEFCSDREAEPIAMALCARGFHACVLRYPVAPAYRFPAALCAAAQAVAWLKKNAETFHIDPKQIAVMGFSAGGHLAASLGVFWNRPFLAEKTGLSPESMRPHKLVLCYPVITSGPWNDGDSTQALLGEAFADDVQRELVSLEKQVTKDTPPAFLWHTYTDPSVPVQNTMLFASALCQAGVPFEAHIYSVGGHGLSLATPLTRDALNNRVQEECAGWLDLAISWLHRQD